MTGTSATRDPLINPLEKLLGYQLRRATLAMGADLGERLEHIGLTMIGLSVLALIEANPDITQSELCRQLAIKRANMAPLVAQLVERGLVERRPADRRSHGLRLTAAGVALSAQAAARVSENEARFLGDLSATEQAALLNFLRGIRAQR